MEGKDGISRQQYSNACYWCAEEQAATHVHVLSRSRQGTQGLLPSTPCDMSLGRQERLVQYRQSGATPPISSTTRVWRGQAGGWLVAVTSVVSGGAPRSHIQLSSQTIRVLPLLFHFVTLCYLYLHHIQISWQILKKVKLARHKWCLFFYILTCCDYLI